MSLLPKWLLDSKKFSANMRRKSLEVQGRLESLQQDVKEFHDLCESSKNRGPLKAPTPREPPPEILFHHILGPDACTEMLLYLPVSSWLQYASTCRSSYEFVHDHSSIWVVYHASNRLFEWSDPSADYETRDTKSEAENKMDITRERCLAHAKAVSHIFKVFNKLRSDRSRSRSSDYTPHVYTRRDKEVAYPMPLRSTGRDIGMIMSAVNTTSGEQRKQILRALTSMTFITAAPLSPANSSMLEIGMITMLVALLSNESGAVKDFAALNLANLLCTPPLTGASLLVSDLLKNPTPSQIDHRNGLRRELTMSSGLSSLVSLLSSPQARVALHGVHSSFRRDRITSMRCQSLANKHASRCIINLLLPDLEICCTDKEGDEGFEWEGDDEVDASGEASKKPRTVAVIRRTGIEMIPVDDSDDSEDEGCDSSLMRILGPTFIDCCCEMTWMCYYFYSTGTFKDSYPMTMTLTQSGKMRGRGVDSLGPFKLGGILDSAFGQASFAFSKTYEGRGAAVPRMGHVCHIGYWSKGKALGLSSVGLYGVWEVVSNDQHFRLNKGGVWRLVPKYVVDGMEGVETWDVRAA